MTLRQETTPVKHVEARPRSHGAAHAQGAHESHEAHEAHQGQDHEAPEVKKEKEKGTVSPAAQKETYEDTTDPLAWPDSGA